MQLDNFPEKRENTSRNDKIKGLWKADSSNAVNWGFKGEVSWASMFMNCHIALTTACTYPRVITIAIAIHIAHFTPCKWLHVLSLGWGFIDGLTMTTIRFADWSAGSSQSDARDGEDWANQRAPLCHLFWSAWVCRKRLNWRSEECQQTVFILVHY